VSTSPAAESRRPYHYGNLREALIETSLKLITEEGVKALTLREIGSRLGVSRMAPYRHFADKAALLAAIGEIGFNRFGDVLEAAARAHRGHYARIEEMGVAYVKFAMENRAHFEVMFGTGGDAPGLDEKGRIAADRAFAILRNAVQDAQQAGKLAGTDPLVVARFVWSTVHGISLLGLEKDPGGSAEFTRRCAQMLKKGLQPR
jgi:AcrR family transcriptional regulator